MLTSLFTTPMGPFFSKYHPLFFEKMFTTPLIRDTLYWITIETVLDYTGLGYGSKLWNKIMGK